MARERRVRERRDGDRRSPSTALDVTRLEHENLYGQVEEVLRALRRIELELQAQGERLEIVEREVEALALRPANGA